MKPTEGKKGIKEAVKEARQEEGKEHSPFWFNKKKKKAQLWVNYQ